MSHNVSPMQQSFVSEMSEMLQRLSQLRSVPDPSADTHCHYQSRPILAHELEEATYNSDDLDFWSIVEWARKQQPPPPRGRAHRYEISRAHSSVLLEYKVERRVEGRDSRDLSR